MINKLAPISHWVVAFALIDLIGLVKGDDLLCRELQLHRDELGNSNREAKSQFAADEECPEEYETRLKEGTHVPVQGMINEIKYQLDTPDQLLRCPPISCSAAKAKRRQQLEVALTYAFYHKCLALMREARDVQGLVFVKELKSMRRQKKGILIADVIYVEQFLLNRLVEACYSDPYRIFGLKPGENDQWIDGTYRQLMQMTDPDKGEEYWGPERDTMLIVNRIVEQAYKKIQGTKENVSDRT